MTKDTQAAAAPSTIDPMAAAREAGQALQRAHDELIARRLALMDKISHLEKEAQALRTSPLRADEFKAVLFDHIDKRAALFPTEAGWGELLETYANPRNDRKLICLDDVDRIAAGGPVTTRLEERQNLLAGFNALPSSNSALIYFFFGDAIKRRLTQYLPSYMTHSGMQLKDEGPTIQEKRERIAALEEALAPLRAELEEVNRNYDELGMLARNTVAPTY